MSAHHYFWDFSYCYSGMILWLLVAQLLSDSGKTLAECVDNHMESFPCSGEINSDARDIYAVMDCIEAYYSSVWGAIISR